MVKIMADTILLINPKSDIEALWFTGQEDSEIKSNMPPLGLVTISALTPEHYHVEI